MQTQRALGKKTERAREECESEQRTKEGSARCKGGRTGEMWEDWADTEDRCGRNGLG